MSLPISAQALDHLKSLGFEAERLCLSNVPGSSYYNLTLARSVEERELDVTFAPNQKGHPSLRCRLVKGSTRFLGGSVPALVSFRSWDDVLAPGFAVAVDKVVALAVAERDRLRAEQQARKDLEASKLAAAKALGAALRGCGLEVDISAPSYCGKVNGLPTTVGFKTVAGSGKCSLFSVLVSGVEVGRSCNGDVEAIARKVTCFVAAVEAAA